MRNSTGPLFWTGQVQIYSLGKHSVVRPPAEAHPWPNQSSAWKMSTFWQPLAARRFWESGQRFFICNISIKRCQHADFLLLDKFNPSLCVSFFVRGVDFFFIDSWFLPVLLQKILKTLFRKKITKICTTILPWLNLVKIFYWLHVPCCGNQVRINCWKPFLQGKFRNNKQTNKYSKVWSIRLRPLSIVECFQNSLRISTCIQEHRCSSEICSKYWLMVVGKFSRLNLFKTSLQVQCNMNYFLIGHHYVCLCQDNYTNILTKSK